MISNQNIFESIRPEHSFVTDEVLAHFAEVVEEKVISTTAKVSMIEHEASLFVERGKNVVKQFGRTSFTPLEDAGFVETTIDRTELADDESFHLRDDDPRSLISARPEEWLDSLLESSIEDSAEEKAAPISMVQPPAATVPDIDKIDAARALVDGIHQATDEQFALA